MHKFYAMLLAAGCVAFSASAGRTVPANLPSKARLKAPAVETPVVLPATDITSTSFTANWKAVPGAETYSLMVYEPVTITESGVYNILEENFNLVSMGSTVEPYFPDDFLVDISALDWTYTPDWQGYLPVFARGMVSGIVYSPYVDLTNNDGKYTVTFSVVGEAGAMVKLTASGSTDDERFFTLTQQGTNIFTAEFDNGIHDTYFTYVDYGILDDPEGNYTDKFDWLDDFAVSQELKAGDTALRLVESVEPSRNTYHFAELPFLYGATTVAYDVQANVVEITDPDDIYGYDVYRSEYSALQYVKLTDEQGGEDPNDPDNPDTPADPEFPDGDDQTFFVGNYAEPTSADTEDGTWWNRAPFQWYTVFSASQMIYTPSMLFGLKEGDIIKEISFKYGDYGSFVVAEADLRLFVDNTDDLTFTQKDDSDKWMWHKYDAQSEHAAYLAYEKELYSMEDEEITFTLTEPLVYKGKSLVVTAISERNGDEAQGMMSYVLHCDTPNTMPFGSDTVPFDDVYATSYNYPYMTPEKWVPVMAVKFDRKPSSVIDAIEAAPAEAGATLLYDLQGKAVDAATALPGIYVKVTAAGAEKVVIR